MSQDQIIRAVAKKTGFSQAALREALVALEEVIIENMQTATFENPSEMRLFAGWKLGAKRLPERMVFNPQNGSRVMTKEKIVPYCSFIDTFRKKINE